MSILRCDWVCEHSWHFWHLYAPLISTFDYPPQLFHSSAPSSCRQGRTQSTRSQRNPPASVHGFPFRTRWFLRHWLWEQRSALRVPYLWRITLSVWLQAGMNLCCELQLYVHFELAGLRSFSLKYDSDLLAAQKGGLAWKYIGSWTVAGSGASVVCPATLGCISLLQSCWPQQESWQY